MSLTWEERAERVRAGEKHLANAPVSVDPMTYKTMFDAVLSHSADAVVLCHTTTGEYYEVSDLFCELTGYTREELLGETSASLGLVDPGGVRLVIQLDGINGRKGVYENVLTSKDGTKRWVQFSHHEVEAGHTLVIIRDITAMKEMEDALRTLASTDPLTRVLNRRSFQHEAQERLASSPDAYYISVDLDHLKGINDRWGHAVGDEAIVTVCDTLVAAAGPGAVVGRVGGDEFAAVLVGDAYTAAVAVERVQVALGALRLASNGETVSASVGVASGRLAYTALERAADDALYAVKRARPPA